MKRRPKPRYEISVHAAVPAGCRSATIVAWARRALTALQPPSGSVSVVMVSPTVSATVNRRYRRRRRPTNVLTFVWPRQQTGDDMIGEIILCPAVIRKESRLAHETYQQRLRMLLEHGCIHLLGFDHHTPRDISRWHRLESQIHP